MFESANAVSSSQSIFDQYGVPDPSSLSLVQNQFGSNFLTRMADYVNSNFSVLNPSTTGLASAMVGNKIDKENAAIQFERQMALQKDQQAANAYEARIAREWTERMSNTANQRAVADLKAAGLNPWLAIANPASSAGGVAASSGQGQASRAENTSTSALNAGIAASAQIVSALIGMIGKVAAAAG